MSRTITAMFDSRSDAEEAKERLRTTLGADARIIDKSSGHSDSSGEGGGFWAGVKDAFMPDEDRHSYDEGIRRGGFMLCATVDENQADQACGVLEGSNTVDLDSREQQWREEGWAGYQGQPQSTRSQGDRRQDNVVEEERIPIVEEQLRVGKRETQRGGARVRSYVEERPVSEQVNLREEQINVERRPVIDSGPLSQSEVDRSDLMKEQQVEMRATGEEPVIGKDARVKEEVVVQKTATERTENVQDTVRETKVDVDGGDRDRFRDR